MANLDLIDGATALAMNRLGRPWAAQVVKISWPAPYQPTYYGFTDVDEWNGEVVFPLSPFEIRMVPDGRNPFLTIPKKGAISDDTVTITMGNIDQKMVSLLRNGEGARLEIFHYFPQLNLTVPMFQGQVQSADKVNRKTVTFTAGTGFRSAQSTLPARAFVQSCAAVYGGELPTLELVADNACPHNFHLGGTIGLPGPDGAPQLFCNKSNLAECAKHLGADLAPKFFLSFLSAKGSQSVPSKRGSYLATSRGNETNLKNPLRVIYGKRVVRDLDLLTYQVQLDKNHQNDGTISFIYAVSEGPIQSIKEIQVNNAPVGQEHIKIALGNIGQDAVLLTDKLSAANYSGVALFRGLLFGNYATFQPSQLAAQAKVEGRNTIKVFSDENNYVKVFTDDTAWCFHELLTDFRFGHMIDRRRYLMQDWIDLSVWFNQQVSTRDAEGNSIRTKRSTFNCDTQGRPASQVVRDICISHRIVPPFNHGGSLRIIPLDKVDINDSIPVFTDRGENPNIVIADDGESMLDVSWKDDRTLPPKVTLMFEDPEIDNQERPLEFVDTKQQAKYAKAFGDNSRSAANEPYTAFGVTDFGQAIRLGWTILHLGPLDEGGIKNNLTVNMTVWGLRPETINLHQYRVIKIESDKVDDPSFVEDTGRKFEYFRVLNIVHRGNLRTDLICQAYPVDYYEALEAEEAPSFMVGAAIQPTPAPVNIVS